MGDDNGDGGAGGADGSMMGEGGEDSAGGKEVDVDSWISWNGERHVCMKCGGSFNRKDHAKRHVINQHIPQPEASCHVCHKTFKNAYYRDTHRSQEHGITKRMMEMKRYSILN